MNFFDFGKYHKEYRVYVFPFFSLKYLLSAYFMTHCECVWNYTNFVLVITSFLAAQKPMALFLDNPIMSTYGTVSGSGLQKCIGHIF
mgnify:CR=1 FL=1